MTSLSADIQLARKLHVYTVVHSLCVRYAAGRYSMWTVLAGCVRTRQVIINQQQTHAQWTDVSWQHAREMLPDYQSARQTDRHARRPVFGVMYCYAMTAHNGMEGRGWCGPDAATGLFIHARVKTIIAHHYNTAYIIYLVSAAGSQPAGRDLGREVFLRFIMTQFHHSRRLLGSTANIRLLADRTDGRAIGAVLRIRLSSVWNVLWLNGAS